MEDAEHTGFGMLIDLAFLAGELCDDRLPCTECVARALRILSGTEPWPWPREDPTAGIVELHGDRKYLV